MCLKLWRRNTGSDTNFVVSSDSLVLKNREKIGIEEVLR